MSRCSPETARSIVDLLLNDHGTAGSWSVQRVTADEKATAIAEETCRGCDQQFRPKAVGRQFCSRACYNAYLERKRDGTLKPKRPRQPRENGSLGPGRRFAGEPYEYTIARAGLSAEQVQTELLAVFGLKVGITTIFRAWRRHAAGRPAPRPPMFSKPVQPATPSPSEPEAPMLTEEVNNALNVAQDIARRLRAVLARKGISQQAAGNLAGVSQTVVSKAYRGNIIAEESRAALVAWLEFEEGAIPTKDVPIEPTPNALEQLKTIAQAEQLTTALGATPQEAEEPREPALHTPVIVEVEEPETLVVIDEAAELPDSFFDKAVDAIDSMEPYSEPDLPRTLRQAVSGLGVLPESDDEPIGLTVPKTLATVSESLAGFEKLRQQFAITSAELERSATLSPADVMVEKIARRGALAELEKHGLELPDRARITISLEWGPAGG